MQWNTLAKKLASPDWFPGVNPQHLSWDYRVSQILATIKMAKPDLICLQEVDEYATFCQSLTDYDGIFAEKFTNGKQRDGCAIFYKKSMFRLIKSSSFRLCQDQSQVAIFTQLLHIKTQQTIHIATTHLKSGPGDVNEKVRKDELTMLLSHFKSYVDTEVDSTAPIIIAGDFNIRFNSLLLNMLKEAQLTSIWNQSDLYTVNVKCADGSQFRDVLDYIYYNSQALNMTQIQIKQDNEFLPNDIVPSDHLPILTRFELVSK
jgi:mRNA deadenylase 3'-5' endonuclease subunit Ccr4